MSLINIQKTKKFISDRKYPFFVLFLIVLIIISIIINSLYGSNQVTPDSIGEQEEVSLENLEEYSSFQDMSNNIQRSYSGSISNFSENSVYNELVSTTINSEEQERIEKDSYVFTYRSYSPSSLDSVLDVESNSYETVGGYIVRFKDITNLNDFLGKYLNLLNSSFSNDYNIAFSLNKTSEDRLVLGEYHFSSPVLETNYTHIQHTYQILLKNNILSETSSKLQIIAVEDVDSGVFEVELPVFFPRVITVSSKRVVQEDTYNLIPSTYSGIEFETFYANHEADLTRENISIIPNSGSVMYLVNIEDNIIFPLIAKKANLVGGDFENLEDNLFYLTEFE